MSFNKTIYIGKHEISEKSKTFLIAEAGVNHGGDMEIAKKLIDVAVNAGVDAVKFQTFKTENIILRKVEKAPYQKKTTVVSESQFEMLKKLEVTKEQNLDLMEYCNNKNIIFLTTSYDEESLDGLDDLDLKAYKVASTDTTNLPFLRRIAQKGKPIILSTGMCYLSEVEMALREISPINKDVILLQCTANYPIEDEEVNLRVIDTYKSKFDILVGYSDHSVGVGAAPYSVVMGAKLVEKHFTLDKSWEGPDQKASLEPEELKELVKSIRRVEKYLGSQIKAPTLGEIMTRMSLQKCLVASKNIKIGDQFSGENLTSKRTGGIGYSPIYYNYLVGKKANKNFNKDDIIEI